MPILFVLSVFFLVTFENFSAIEWDTEHERIYVLTDPCMRMKQKRECPYLFRRTFYWPASTYSWLSGTAHVFSNFLFPVPFLVRACIFILRQARGRCRFFYTRYEFWKMLHSFRLLFRAQENSDRDLACTKIALTLTYKLAVRRQWYRAAGKEKKIFLQINSTY